MGTNKVTTCKSELLKDVYSENFLEAEKKWPPERIVSILDYKSAMLLAKDLYVNGVFKSLMEEFSVSLFFAIREKFLSDWDKDWKNDVFLGQLCRNTWRDEDGYVCYKRAYDKLDDPPHALLLLLAGCNSMPGTPCLTKEEAFEFLQHAIKKKVTYEAALMMRGFCHDREDKEQEKYWNQMVDKLEKENVHAELLRPDIFVE
jgi:hypothetical protein